MGSRVWASNKSSLRIQDCLSVDNDPRILGLEGHRRVIFICPIGSRP